MFPDMPPCMAPCTQTILSNIMGRTAAHLQMPPHSLIIRKREHCSCFGSVVRSIKFGNVSKLTYLGPQNYSPLALARSISGLCAHIACFQIKVCILQKCLAAFEIPQVACDPTVKPHMCSQRYRDLGLPPSTLYQRLFLDYSGCFHGTL